MHATLNIQKSYGQDKKLSFSIYFEKWSLLLKKEESIIIFYIISKIYIQQFYLFGKGKKFCQRADINIFGTKYISVWLYLILFLELQITYVDFQNTGRDYFQENMSFFILELELPHTTKVGYLFLSIINNLDTKA